MANYKYENFERWFDEPEEYGLKSERFYDILGYQFATGNVDYAYIEQWLRAAFNAARQQKEVNRFLCSECTPGECTHAKSTISKRK